MPRRRGLRINRGPRALADSLEHRRQREACAYPIGLQLREHLHAWQAGSPHRPLYYVVGNDLSVLPYLDDPALSVTLVTPVTFVRLLDQRIVRPGDLVIEDVQAAADRLVQIDQITASLAYYPSVTATQSIYQVKDDPLGARSPVR